ncbi:thioredoxin-like ferredoxin [Nitzschia inconspicua]|uniref:Thioredoxin-like ferredoxin n=1 Tax=Nitzschia inconspicua TaxID=303405 RepID=A0A9K3LNN4_9STRA|nr:thioredoxin-like ferredoxin [Nitzschia inconspicua]
MHSSLQDKRLFLVFTLITTRGLCCSALLFRSFRATGLRHQNAGRICSFNKETEIASIALPDDSVLVQERKFKVVTCMSTACYQKRKYLGLDSLSTFGAMYARASSTSVRVEESPCLGSCQFAPCVAVEHDDYYGFVALEGMTNEEFGAKAFHNIITEEDLDRVWTCIENAARLMAAAEEECQE